MLCLRPVPEWRRPACHTPDRLGKAAPGAGGLEDGGEAWRFPPAGWMTILPGRMPDRLCGLRAEVVEW